MSSGPWPIVPAAIAFLAVCVLAGWLIDRAQKARRRRAFDTTYGSLDRVSAQIDRGALRVIRETRGEINAVRELRRQVPELSLGQAVELVRGL